MLKTMNKALAWGLSAILAVGCATMVAAPTAYADEAPLKEGGTAAYTLTAGQSSLFTTFTPKKSGKYTFTYKVKVTSPKGYKGKLTHQLDVMSKACYDDIIKPGKTLTGSFTVTLKKGKTYRVISSLYGDSGKPLPKNLKVSAKYTVKHAGATTKYLPNSKRPAIKKATGGKGKMTVKWTKKSGVAGYQVRYANKEEASWKTITVKSKSKTSVTIKKLSNKAPYGVQVRSYKNVKQKGKTVKMYSKWSAAEEVVVK